MTLRTFRLGTIFKDKKRGRLYEVKSISLDSGRKVVHAEPLADGKALNFPHEILQGLEQYGRIEIIKISTNKNKEEK